MPYIQRYMMYITLYNSVHWWILLVQHISRIECMLSCGPPTSKIIHTTFSYITLTSRRSDEDNLYICFFTEQLHHVTCNLPTVLIPSLADKIGPIVEPHGTSFRTPNSCRENVELHGCRQQHSSEAGMRMAFTCQKPLAIIERLRYPSIGVRVRISHPYPYPYPLFGYDFQLKILSVFPGKNKRARMVTTTT